MLLPVVLAACGGSSSTAVGGDPVATAADATAQQASEKTDVQATIDLAGQKLTLGGSGAFDKARDGMLHLAFTLPGVGSSKLDEVFRGNVVWISSPLLTSTLNGKTWAKLDLGKQAKALGFNLAVLTGQTPSAALSVLRLPASGSVTTVGKDTIDGVETTHYRKELGGAKASGNTYNSVDAWVDGRNLVRKLQLDYGASIDPTSKEPAHTVVTMTLSGFGTPVTATPPAAADTGELGG